MQSAFTSFPFIFHHIYIAWYVGSTMPFLLLWKLITCTLHQLGGNGCFSMSLALTRRRAARYAVEQVEENDTENEKDDQTIEDADESVIATNGPLYTNPFIDSIAEETT